MEQTKKLLYLSNWNIRNSIDSCGVSKKIISQSKEFARAGFQVRTILRKDHETYTFLFPEGTVTKAQLKNNKLPVRVVFYPFELEEAKKNVFDVIYLRYAGIDWFFFEMVKALRRYQPTAKILLEIPTYPYEREYEVSLPQKLFLQLDKHLRQKLKKYIDSLVVVSSSFDELFGIPCVSIANGIEIDEISIRNCRKTDAIHIICAAMFERAHGVDRFLMGMKNYYYNGGKRELRLHLVGDGGALPELQKIAACEQLKNRVLFYGRLDTKAIEAIYDQCDMGIESLGCHRKSITESSSLKSREYLAKGLPFFGSVKIDVFKNKEVAFFYQCDSTEAPVDINHIIEFYDDLYPKGTQEEKEELAREIRNFAKRTVDISKTFSPVIEYLNKK